MPELPEVETICRGLIPLILGKTICKVLASGKSLREPVPLALLNQGLAGAEVKRLSRRAKFLLIECANGWLLVVHLGMTGNLGVYDSQMVPAPHCHIRFLFTDGTELRYTDSRRFGSVRILNPEEAANVQTGILAGIGPEPLDPDCMPSSLFERAQNRAQSVKQLLMDGRFIAGIGNIYASEILFHAGIRPDRSAASLSLAEWQNVLACAQTVLLEAISCGGSSIKNYLNANQQKGYFQMNFRVYGRDGQPCKRCGGLIDRTILGGRATYSCADCQH